MAICALKWNMSFSWNHSTTQKCWKIWNNVPNRFLSKTWFSLNFCHRKNLIAVFKAQLSHIYEKLIKLVNLFWQFSYYMLKTTTMHHISSKNSQKINGKFYKSICLFVFWWPSVLLVPKITWRSLFSKKLSLITGN